MHSSYLRRKRVWVPKGATLVWEQQAAYTSVTLGRRGLAGLLCALLAASTRLGILGGRSATVGELHCYKSAVKKGSRRQESVNPAQLLHHPHHFFQRGSRPHLRHHALHAVAPAWGRGERGPCLLVLRMHLLKFKRSSATAAEASSTPQPPASKHTCLQFPRPAI